MNNPNELIKKGFSIKDIIEKEDGDVIKPHDLSVLTDEKTKEEIFFKKKNILNL